MNLDKWSFGKSADEAQTGWNNPAISIFKGERLKNLTRETIQNSLDAAMEDGKCVRVEYRKHHIKRSKMPGIDSLEEALNLCYTYGKKHNYEKQHMDEVAQAQKILGEEKQIAALSVSDFGTKGMSGPGDGTDFSLFLKGDGTTRGSTNRAGSHGIGKAALLCSSYLRTIMVSTRFRNESGEEKSLVQGRATLMGHRHEEVMRIAAGYWGNIFDPIPEDLVSPKYNWIIRPQEIGTTIHILGWVSSSSEWKRCIIGHAVKNFFPAFVRKKLEVCVSEDGGMSRNLNHENIKSILFSEKFREILEQDGDREFGMAKYFYKCLAGEESIKIENIEVEVLGQCTVYLLVEVGAPKKVALIRKNMLIYASIPGVPSPPRFEDFAGVVEVNEEGEKFLRKMEPAAHDNLKADRLLTPQEKKKGDRALKSLVKEIKKVVERYAAPEQVSGKEIEYLAKYLAVDAEDDDAPSDADEIDPEGRFVLNPLPFRSSPLPREPDDNETEEGEEVETTSGGVQGGDRSNTKTTTGPNEGNEMDRKPPAREQVLIRDIRVVKTGLRALRVYATVDKETRARLSVKEVGADSEDNLLIKETSHGDCIDGGVNVYFQTPIRVCMEMTVSREIIGGVRIVQRSWAG